MVEVSRRTVVVAVGGSTVSLAAITFSRARGRPPGPSAGPTRTSFGSVAVLGSSRVAASGPTHEGHAHGQAMVASAVHGAWTAGVVVDVAVRNRLRRPVELSPGQFRLRVDREGPTVSLYSADVEAAPLEPGSTRALRISYLAPPPELPLTLLFDDTGSQTPVQLGLVGRPTAEEAWS